jgi:hypothetical protein
VAESINHGYKSREPTNSATTMYLQNVVSLGTTQPTNMICCMTL